MPLSPQAGTTGNNNNRKTIFPYCRIPLPEIVDALRVDNLYDSP